MERELRRIAKMHGLDLVLTEGGNHTKAVIGTWQEPLPRHREIPELLARAIIRRCKKELGED